MKLCFGGISKALLCLVITMIYLPLFFTPCPASALSSVTLTLYVHEGSAGGPVIPGAQVSGSDGDGRSFSLVTNGSGYMTITGYAGMWSFVASANGYQSVSWSQSITSTCTRHAFLSKLPQQAPVYQPPAPQQPAYQPPAPQPPVYQPPSPSYQTPQQVTLTLYVHEGSTSGQLLQGAQVNGYDGANSYFNQTTDSSGYMTITGVPGTWQFTASGNGYDDNTWSQPITSTGRKDAYIFKTVQQQLPAYQPPTYQPPASQPPAYQPPVYQPPAYQTPQQVTLTLYVHEGSVNGPLLQGARVTGSDAGSNYFNQITNSNGYVTITGVPGTWQFTASGNGYDDNTWPQSITSTAQKDAYIFKTTLQQSPSYQAPQQPNTSSSYPWSSYQAPSYQTTTYVLSIVTNGQGTTTPASYNSYNRDAGSLVTISAHPADGWKFDHWAGDVTGTSPSITITMNSNYDIIAYFALAKTETFLDLVKGVWHNIFSGNTDTENCVISKGEEITLPMSSGVTFIVYYYENSSAYSRVRWKQTISSLVINTLSQKYTPFVTMGIYHATSNDGPWEEIHGTNGEKGFSIDPLGGNLSLPYTSGVYKYVIQFRNAPSWENQGDEAIIHLAID